MFLSSQDIITAVLAATTAVSAASFKRAADINSYAASPVEFTYPPPRPFTAANASTGPCGGATVSSSRTSFPLTGGKVGISATGLVTNVNFLYVNDANPVRFHSFSTYSQSVLNMANGDYCLNAPDFSSLNIAGDVTLLTTFQLYGSNTSYYHCADITLVSASEYTAPTEATSCINDAVLIDVADDEQTMKLAGSDYSQAQRGVDGQTVPLSEASVQSTSETNSHGFVSASEASSSSSGSGSSLSAAAGGGIGAGVAVAALGAVFVLLLLTRRLVWSKKGNAENGQIGASGRVEMAQGDSHSLDSSNNGMKA